MEQSRYRRAVLLLGLAAAALTAGAAGSRAARAEPARPNIIIILADDLGWSDLGCYGGEIRTPNLDRLAKNGLRFTRFYNSARCCPTRASLLTGLYPHQAGVGAMTFDRGLPGYRGQLRKETPTLAEVLRGAGYRTAMSGKWHLSLTREGPNHLRRLNNQEIAGSFADRDSYPTARGFERYYGPIWGVVNFWDPFSLVDGVEAVRSVPRGYYITDALTDRAIADVEAFSREPRQPFFLYLAHTAPHWPLHARPQDIARYRDTYQAGWDRIRAARFGKQVRDRLVNSGAVLPPRAQPERRWEENPDRAWDAAAMAAHAAMVDRMDQNIGRLVRRLEALGQLENSLIFFLSDNGASHEAYAEGGFDRPTETRDGRRILHPKELREKGFPPGDETTFGAYGPVWATVSNTPFRYWKAQMSEGGICTPLIAHWPAGTRPKGALRREPGHVVDLMATALDASGARLPAEWGGAKTTPLEGRSLLPVLRGGSFGERPLYFEHEGNMAMLEGDWKAVNTRAAGGTWQLYNLASDRTEMRDLAAKEPERLRDMVARWHAWAERARVKPAPHSFRELAAPKRPGGGS